MPDPVLDQRLTLCSTTYVTQAYLWDADWDGNVKHGIAETAEERRVRHAVAKAVCNHLCTQTLACRSLAEKDPHASGVRGGVLL